MLHPQDLADELCGFSGMKLRLANWCHYSKTIKMFYTGNYDPDKYCYSILWFLDFRHRGDILPSSVSNSKDLLLL